MLILAAKEKQLFCIPIILIMLTKTQKVSLIILSLTRFCIKISLITTPDLHLSGKHLIGALPKWKQ